MPHCLSSPMFMSSTLTCKLYVVNCYLLATSLNFFIIKYIKMLTFIVWAVVCRTACLLQHFQFDVRICCQSCSFYGNQHLTLVLKTTQNANKPNFVQVTEGFLKIRVFVLVNHAEISVTIIKLHCLWGNKIKQNIELGIIGLSGQIAGWKLGFLATSSTS